MGHAQHVSSLEVVLEQEYKYLYGWVIPVHLLKIVSRYNCIVTDVIYLFSFS